MLNIQNLAQNQRHNHLRSNSGYKYKDFDLNRDFVQKNTRQGTFQDYKVIHNIQHKNILDTHQVKQTLQPPKKIINKPIHERSRSHYQSTMKLEDFFNQNQIISNDLKKYTLMKEYTQENSYTQKNDQSDMIQKLKIQTQNQTLLQSRCEMVKMINSYQKILQNPIQIQNKQPQQVQKNIDQVILQIKGLEIIMQKQAQIRNNNTAKKLKENNEIQEIINLEHVNYNKEILSQQKHLIYNQLQQLKNNSEQKNNKIKNVVLQLKDTIINCKDRLPMQAKFEFSEDIYKQNIQYKNLDFNYDLTKMTLQKKCQAMISILQLTFQKMQIKNFKTFFIQLLKNKQTYDLKIKRQFERKLQGANHIFLVIKKFMKQRLQKLLDDFKHLNQRKKIHSSLSILNSNQEYQHIKASLEKSQLNQSQNDRSQVMKRNELNQSSLSQKLQQNRVDISQKEDNQNTNLPSFKYDVSQVHQNEKPNENQRQNLIINNSQVSFQEKKNNNTSQIKQIDLQKTPTKSEIQSQNISQNPILTRTSLNIIKKYIQETPVDGKSFNNFNPLISQQNDVFKSNILLSNPSPISKETVNVLQNFQNSNQLLQSQILIQGDKSGFNNKSSNNNIQ